MPRLLEYEEAGTSVDQPWLGPISYAFEPAGKAFLEAQLKLAGLMPYHEDSDSSSDEEDASRATDGASI